MVTIWDTTTGRRQHELFFRKQDNGDEPCGAAPIVFSPDSKLIASGSRPGVSICIWKIGKDMPYPKIEFSFSHEDGLDTAYEAIRALAFSPDAKLLVSLSDDGQLRLWYTNNRDETVGQ